MDNEHNDNKTINIPYWLVGLITFAFLGLASIYFSINNQISEMRSDIRVIKTSVNMVNKLQTQVYNNEREIDRIKYILKQDISKDISKKDSLQIYNNVYDLFID